MPPRVVSLLPAATEIVGALGLAEALVGVSHECDHPPSVQALPRITRCAIHGNALPSAETDAWVRQALATAGTLYTLDEPALRTLRPDVIITQKLCDVCAVGFETVTAFAATLPGPPVVVNLEPQTLDGVFGDVQAIATALGVPERATALVRELRARIDAVRTQVRAAPRRRCVLLEWIDPPYRSGHWGPELVTLAGGDDPIGRAGEDAVAIDWDAVREAAPEVLILACCGYDVARTRRDLPVLRAVPGFDALPCARSGEVWILDGSAYVSRPGPRLVDSLEIIARILHPACFPAGALPDGVARA